MSYQKCPRCEGTGLSYLGRIVFNSSEKCKTCKGQGIINEQTGEPPSSTINDSLIGLVNDRNNG